MPFDFIRDYENTEWRYLRGDEDWDGYDEPPAPDTGNGDTRFPVGNKTPDTGGDSNGNGA